MGRIDKYVPGARQKNEKERKKDQRERIVVRYLCGSIRLRGSLLDELEQASADGDRSTCNDALTHTIHMIRAAPVRACASVQYGRVQV